MKALILAAGIGSRLGRTHPKALTSLLDDKSIMSHQIEGLSHYMNIKETFNFLLNSIKISCFKSCFCLNSITMHWITKP